MSKELLLRILRNTAAVIVGSAVGMAVNIGLIFTNMAIFPGPEGLDFNDTPAMVEYIGTLPQSAFVLVLLAHVGQAAVGGLVAALLGGSRYVMLSMIVAALTFIGGVANMMMLPGPWWLYAEFPLYLLVGWGAGALVARLKA